MPENIEANVAIKDDASLVQEYLQTRHIGGVINRVFAIDVNQPLPYLSNEFCDAYAVNNISGATEPYYALVFKSKYPINILDILKQIKHRPSKFYAGPVACGISKLSDKHDEQFMAIMPRIEGTSLYELIKKNVRFDREVLFDKVLPIFLQVLDGLHKIGCSYGQLNPHTVLISKSGQIMLDENISVPIGYRQDIFFETIERAQCHKLGKAPHCPSADYYALGVMIFYLLTGKSLAEHNPREVIRAKLAVGTFNLLHQMAGMDGDIADLVKALVLDEHNQRWGRYEIERLLGGRSYQMAKCDYTYLLQRPIIFNGKEIFSKKLLAYELYLHWEEAKEFVNSDKIKKWLESSVQGQDTLQIMQSFFNDNQGRSLNHRLLSITDDKMIKTLIALDPDAPFRYNNVVFDREATGAMLAYALYGGGQEMAQFISNLIYSNTFALYEIVSNILNQERYQSYMKELNQAANLVKKSEIGFGIERVVYELNPYYTCQSAFISARFCLNIDDVLLELESHTLSFNEVFAKKTIPAFLAAKLSIAKELKLENYDEFPNIQKSKIAQVLQLLGTCQKVAKIPKLVKLCNMLSKAMIELFETYLANTKTIKKISAKLELLAASGEIPLLISGILNSDFVNKDNTGYVNAMRRCMQIEQELAKYKPNGEPLNILERIRVATKNSLQYAVRLSYAILGLSTLALLYTFI